MTDHRAGPLGAPDELWWRPATAGHEVGSVVAERGNVDSCGGGNLRRRPSDRAPERPHVPRRPAVHRGRPVRDTAPPDGRSPPWFSPHATYQNTERIEVDLWVRAVSRTGRPGRGVGRRRDMRPIFPRLGPMGVEDRVVRDRERAAAERWDAHFSVLRLAPPHQRSGLMSRNCGPRQPRGRCASRPHPRVDFKPFGV